MKQYNLTTTLARGLCEDHRPYKRFSRKFPLNVFHSLHLLLKSKFLKNNFPDPVKLNFFLMKKSYKAYERSF